MSRFTSIHPQDIAWRAEQVRVDHYIEGIVPDPDIEKFVSQLDSKESTDNRIHKIIAFIKEKGKEE